MFPDLIGSCCFLHDSQTLGLGAAAAGEVGAARERPIAPRVATSLHCPQCRATRGLLATVRRGSKMHEPEMGSRGAWSIALVGFAEQEAVRD